ncbi:MAG: CoA transferase [Burkholderiales bacterium]|nr:CoA transferase [Burkholderiales bacterium]
MEKLIAPERDVTPERRDGLSSEGAAQPSDMPLPLRGIKVLDLSRVLAGPYCCSLLGELGADVIKIERPGRGDENRRWGGLYRGESLDYMSVNRNKRDVTVDIKTPGGQEIIRKLARTSDVLVENFVGDVLAGLGLGYQQLAALNERLVYCSISAYGSRGPLKDKPGYDGAVQAFSGHMAMTGEANGGPVRTGASMVDMATGITAYAAILTALQGRQSSGRGQRVSVSLLQTALALMGAHAATFLMTGHAPARAGSGVSHLAPYGAFPTADSYIVTGALNDDSWRELCRIVDRADLLADERFVNEQQRLHHRAPLDAALNETFRTRTTAHWVELFEANGFVISAVNGLRESLNHAQVQANDMIVSAQHEVVGEVKLVAVPMSFEQWRLHPRRPPPLLGRHTDEVLAELGYTPREIEALRAEGAI